jgi:hypothetical protein
LQAVEELSQHSIEQMSQGRRVAVTAPIRVPAFPDVDDLTAVSVVDLLGRGTACLTWSSMLPGDAGRTVRFVDLMGAKPHLLTRMRNNLGAETVLTYASSTTFLLADQAAGTPRASGCSAPACSPARRRTTPVGTAHRENERSGEYRQR